ncbi:protein translocase subunit SecF [Nocardioides caeni]|uniref:Protein-export membrane protein SecF n=1 Tax=Nocardioides caeni TaxID=574700 RepID=A0A4S8NEC5_9ACTN|nr:protein translocase subunit SecF [Nocardioides caeni]THV13349.1 protein translocase subunit SecF [Nocardioides caeni]
MGKMSRLGNDLYQGRRSVDFVGNPWRWYAISLVVIALAALVLYVKPLNMGVEFTGGTTFTVSVGSGNADQDAADELRDAVGESDAEVGTPLVTTEGDRALTLTTDDLDSEGSSAVRDVILEVFPDISDSDISEQDIGPSWGAEVAKQALTGIVIFLVAVVFFIWAYFREWRMSVAALLALFHDIALVVGVYALSGFQVTPAAVTGLLAILGFSLYDTVVVFDKVKENTTVLRKNTQSYADAANLAVNQTLVRSINTGIVALIPLGTILYFTGVQLGASSLKDLALVQFVGMAVGVYSSVVLAPRILVHMKMRETEVQLQARRARAKQRALADRYAAVPVFKDEGTAVGRPGAGGADLEDPDELRDLDDQDERPASGPGSGTVTSKDPFGKGRTVPQASRPVTDGGSSGRSQPVRQARSKRGKK